MTRDLRAQWPPSGKSERKFVEKLEICDVILGVKRSFLAHIMPLYLNV